MIACSTHKVHIPFYLFFTLMSLTYHPLVCRDALLQRLRGHMVALSMHKFASNVVEKGLEFGSEEQRDVIVCEILAETTEGSGFAAHLQDMIRDQFGNYVVQKVLDVSDSCASCD